MKKLSIFAIVAIAALAVGCENTFFPGKIEDIPSVDFYQDSMTVSAAGGEMIVPVTSTGVDDVNISFYYFDRWEIDEETGDLTPTDGWIKLVKVINDYDNPTRALPVEDSGICIEVEPNTTGYERKATITVRSFTKTDSIEIIQAAE